MYNAGVMDWVIIGPIKSVYDQRAAARHNGGDGSWRGVNIPPIVLHNQADDKQTCRPCLTVLEDVVQSERRWLLVPRK